MDLGKRLLVAATLAGLVAAAPLVAAQADKLDDVINEGKVRCAVVLDFPPIGFYDENNEPAGFDVEYCKDLAKALDVEFELLPVTWAERLPVIVSNRADVVFGGTSDSLERAKTVGFSIPYAIYYAQAVVGKDSGIVTFEDMRGKRVAAAVGTVPEQEYLKIAEEWGVVDLYQGYQSENEVFLAVAQGKVDAGNPMIGKRLKKRMSWMMSGILRKASRNRPNVTAPAQRDTDSSQPKPQPRTVPIEIDRAEINRVRPAASARKARSEAWNPVKNWVVCANSYMIQVPLSSGTAAS